MKLYIWDHVDVKTMRYFSVKCGNASEYPGGFPDGKND